MNHQYTSARSQISGVEAGTEAGPEDGGNVRGEDWIQSGDESERCMGSISCSPRNVGVDSSSTASNRGGLELLWGDEEINRFVNNHLSSWQQ